MKTIYSQIAGLDDWLIDADIDESKLIAIINKYQMWKLLHEFIIRFSSIVNIRHYSQTNPDSLANDNGQFIKPIRFQLRITRLIFRMIQLIWI